MITTQILFTGHATRRMAQRGITVQEVERVLALGEIIESYPDDTPYPSVLLLGYIDARPVHVVAAERTDAAETIVITVYEPAPERWDATFRTRVGS